MHFRFTVPCCADLVHFCVLRTEETYRKLSTPTTEENFKIRFSQISNLSCIDPLPLSYGLKTLVKM